VKKTIKISGAIITALLYSIAVILFAENVSLQVSAVSEPQTACTRLLFETCPSGILGVPITQESINHIFAGSKYSESDFQSKKFSACLKYCEKTFSSAFVQYVIQTKNFPVKLRKADFLFPFHYFW
jgi:hypothetical protein